MVARRSVGYRVDSTTALEPDTPVQQTVAENRKRSAASDSALRVALVVAFAHGLTDAYASFLPPLLPRLMGELRISIAMAATLTVVFGISGSLPQPLLGYLADRYGRRMFAVMGPLLAGVAIGSIGLASSFGWLIVVLTVAGIGNAAFHPPGAAYAARVGEGKGAGRRYSVFAFGGAAGFAIGPLAAVWIVQRSGLDGLWVALLPALVFAPLIFLGLPRDDDRHAAALPPPPGAVLAQLRGPLGVMFGISATMSFVQRSFLTMEPIIVAEGGGSETLGAVALSVYLGAQSFGMVMGGLLADQMNRRTLLLRLCFAALPAHLAAVWLGPTSAVGLVAIATAGFLGLATLPPLVVMAQESLPSAAGVSSGIVMGLAWATGSIGVLGTGALADALGAYPAALLAMPVMLVAVALAFHPAIDAVSRPPVHAA